MATTERPAVQQVQAPPSRIRITQFVIAVQAILFFAHWFVYETFTFFWTPLSAHGLTALRVCVLLLSVSFITASLIAHRYWNVWARVFYRAAAVWLGLLNFFFVAACVSWLLYLGIWLSRAAIARQNIAAATFGLAILAGIYGLVNARVIRVKRITANLPNLPASWRGRVIAHVSDVHLGHVNGARFMRRIIARLEGLRPDAVLITGDLYDGTKTDLDALVATWKQFAVPFGMYFVTGNHEEFSDRSKFLRAVDRAGIRVLNNEKVTLDGLQIIGVHDRESSYPESLRSILESADLDSRRTSILLTHAPRGLRIAAEMGISLRLCGHTHGGQIFPFTWFTRRVFGDYTYGLKRFGALTVYTTSGAGTWGPPMRVGPHPEIVLIELQ